MTIIAILLAFAVCHFFREVARLRQNRWLNSWVNMANDALGGLPRWTDVTGFLLLFGLPLAALLLINDLLVSLMGTTGGFLLALAVLIYCFGPHDLDTDVDGIVNEEDTVLRNEKLGRLLGGTPPDDPTECRAEAVESIFREALRRWFGVIFWFALLGVAGAFVYRISGWLARNDYALSEEQRSLFQRMQQIMDWPAAQLMTLSLAMATDFDSVFKAWKTYHDEQGHGLFEGDNGFLLAAARRVVMSGHAAQDGYADQLDGPLLGLQQAMDLAWRMLGVWLTVLAILLLVGILA